MLRKHIERIVRFPVTIIILAIFATAFFAYQFKDLHMVLDPKAILPQDHPYVKLNNEIEKQFGGSRVVVIGVASKDGDIFNPSDIEKIRLINEEAKKLPGILENNVVSIADRKVKYVKAEGDSLEIKGLLEGIEYTPEGMAMLKQRVYSNPMFINSLISADGTVAAIILDFKGGAGDWWQKAGSGAEQKAEVRSKKLEVRSQRQEARGKSNDVIARRPKADEAISNPATLEIASGLKSLAMTGSNAWAEEDWKKWQAGKGGADSQKGEEKPSAEGQAGKWPAGGEGGWSASGGDGKGGEQWYVSDATIHKKVLEIVDKYKDANTEIYVGGLPVALSFLEADSWRMSRYIYPLALVIIMFVLYFAFRSIQGMILPIVCALLSVVWAVGLMGVFKIPLDPWNMMTPILILAVAAGHSVQILKRYYEELESQRSEVPPTVIARDEVPKQSEKEIASHPSGARNDVQGASGEGSHWDRESSKQAVVESLTKIGPVMITAGVVAAASFASLLTFKLKTFQSFGLFTAFGILSALILEMTFIPAARSLMRPPKKGGGQRQEARGKKQEARSKKQEARGKRQEGTPSPLMGEERSADLYGRPQELSILDRFLISVSNLVSNRSWLVWLGLVVVIAISFYGINKLTIINSLKGLFFESTQFRKDDAALNKYFGGTATFYVYIEGQPDSLKDPAVLRAIEGLQHEIESVPEVGKAQSYVDYVKAMNQSMHGGDAAYRTIPDDKSTIAEYLFLFSISGSQGEMDRFLDYQYQKSVVWVFLRDDSTVLGEKLIAIVDKYTGGEKSEARSQKSEILSSVIARAEGPKQSGKEIASHPSGARNDIKFPPGIKVGVAGSIPVMMALNQTMVSGKIWNILQIAGIVFAITSIVLRSPVGGILVLLPLGIAVLVNFGVLGIAGIGLGVGTAAISAMAVGFGADYSIYLLYRLREEVRSKKSEARGKKQEARGKKQEARSKTEDMEDAVQKTLLTAGKAIIFVATAMAAGGVTLLFTGYYLHMEGFLVPLAMLTSSLATLIVLPAVVALVKPGFIYR